MNFGNHSNKYEKKERFVLDMIAKLIDLLASEFHAVGFRDASTNKIFMKMLKRWKILRILGQNN